MQGSSPPAAACMRAWRLVYSCKMLVSYVVWLYCIRGIILHLCVIRNDVNIFFNCKVLAGYYKYVYVGMHVAHFW